MTLIPSTDLFDAQGNLKPLVQTDETELVRKPCGSLHYSEDYLGNLMVVQRGFGHADTDDVLAGKADAELVFLSADGRAFVNSWHRGPETGGGVYVEIHDRQGRVMHGWVNSQSRKVVQFG